MSIQVKKTIKGAQLDQILDRIKGCMHAEIEVVESEVKSITLLDARGYEAVTLTAGFNRFEVSYREPEEMDKFIIAFNPDRPAGKRMLKLGRSNKMIMSGCKLEDAVEFAEKMWKDIADDDTSRYPLPYGIDRIKCFNTCQGLVEKEAESHIEEYAINDIVDGKKAREEKKANDEEMPF